jgi:hypothetical protein
MAFIYGWTQADLDQAAALASSYGAPLEDILAIWNSESGLYPRPDAKAPQSILNAANIGYFGLIMGQDAFVTQQGGMQGGMWKSIVENDTIAKQILAIKRFWDGGIRTWLKALAGQEDTVLRNRAAQLGITTAGLLYALNFVPAWTARMKTADAPMIRSAEQGGGDPNAPDTEARYYKDNQGFDPTNKGYITLRDIDLRISRLRDVLYASAAKSLLTVPVSYTTPSTTEKPAPKKTSHSPWPAIFGFGIVIGGIWVGLHYLEKAIPKS